MFPGLDRTGLGSMEPRRRKSDDQYYKNREPRQVLQRFKDSMYGQIFPMAV